MSLEYSVSTQRTQTFGGTTDSATVSLRTAWYGVGSTRTNTWAYSVGATSEGNGVTYISRSGGETNEFRLGSASYTFPVDTEYGLPAESGNTEEIERFVKYDYDETIFNLTGHITRRVTNSLVTEYTSYGFTEDFEDGSPVYIEDRVDVGNRESEWPYTSPEATTPISVTDSYTTGGTVSTHQSITNTITDDDTKNFLVWTTTGANKDLVQTLQNFPTITITGDPTTRETVSTSTAETVFLTEPDLTIVPVSVLTNTKHTTKGSVGQTGYQSEITTSRPSLYTDFSEYATFEYASVNKTDTTVPASVTDPFVPPSYTWSSTIESDAATPITITVMDNNNSATVTTQSLEQSNAGYSTGDLVVPYQLSSASELTDGTTLSFSDGEDTSYPGEITIQQSSILAYGVRVPGIALEGHKPSVTSYSLRDDFTYTTVETPPYHTPYNITGESTFYTVVITLGGTVTRTSDNSTLVSVSQIGNSVDTPTGFNYGLNPSASVTAYNKTPRQYGRAVTPALEMSSGIGVGISGPGTWASRSDFPSIAYSTSPEGVIFPFHPNGTVSVLDPIDPQPTDTDYPYLGTTYNYKFNSSLDSATWSSYLKSTQLSGTNTIVVKTDTASTTFKWDVITPDDDGVVFHLCGVGAGVSVFRHPGGTGDVSYSINNAFEAIKYDDTGGSVSYTSSGGAYSSINSGEMLAARNLPFYKATVN